MERAALTSDYAGNKVDLKPRLEAIAEAGFSHYMHCHGWNSSELYEHYQMTTIREWTQDIGLEVVDVHGSIGPKQEVYSWVQHAQDRGIRLVENRVALAETLQSDVVVLHIPSQESQHPHFWPIVDRFIDRIAPTLEKSGVRIALENLDRRPNLNSNFQTINEALRRYPADIIGLCYDSGHGNVDGDGITRLKQMKDRLIAVHLHDNDGSSDQHNLIGEGTVRWNRLAGVLAESSYTKPISSESSMSDSLGMTGTEQEFLKVALERTQKISELVKDAKKS